MENTLIINKNLRTITIPESVKNLGVESDDGVLRLQFTMPKTYGDIDLSAFNIRINYTNAAGEGDVYPVVDNAVAGDNITFSWLVGRFATKAKGNVKFNVCLRELDEAGDVAREFNTTPAVLPVLEGLETTGAVVQQNPDILEEMQRELSSTVKTVNGITPDKNGNVQVETGGGAGIMSIYFEDTDFIDTGDGEEEVWIVTREQYDAIMTNLNNHVPVYGVCNRSGEEDRPVFVKTVTNYESEYIPSFDGDWVVGR